MILARTKIISIGLGISCLLASDASAETFDAPDAASLVATMEQAEASPGADTIRLGSRETYDFSTEYSAGLALPVVSGAVTILGSGSTLAWSGERDEGTGFFRVAPGGELELRRIEVTGATASAIEVDGNLVLRRTRLQDNRNKGRRGAGALQVNQSGSATIRRTVFQDNVFDYGTCPNQLQHRAYGAAIDNAGRLDLNGVTFTGNRTIAYGGNFGCYFPFRWSGVDAIYNFGTARVVNSTFHDDPDLSSSSAYVINEGSIAFEHVTSRVLHFHNRGDGSFTVANSVLVGAECTNLDSHGHNVVTGSCRLNHPTDRIVSPLSVGLASELRRRPYVPILLPGAGSPLLDTANPEQCPKRDAPGRLRPVDGDHDGTALCDIGATELAPGAYPVDGRVTGLWYEPERDGHYLLVEQPAPGRLTVFWATYDGSGEPLWVFGNGPVEGNSATMTLILQRGMRFGLFDRADLAISQWGEMTLEFEDCSALEMAWKAEGDPALDGEAALTRLTQIQGQECLP